MNYLRYVELDANNLQFFLWFQDYRRRFEALSEVGRSLSPEWIPSIDIEEAVSDCETASSHSSPQFISGLSFEDGLNLQPCMFELEVVQEDTNVRIFSHRTTFSIRNLSNDRPLSS